MGILLGIAGAATGHRFPDGDGVNPVVLIVANSTAAFLVLSLQLRKSRMPWCEFFRPRVPWVRLLPVFLLIMVGEMLAVSELENWMKKFVPPPQSLLEHFRPLGDLAAHPFSGPFALIVVAAVTEEFVFRGLILRGLLARTSPVRAITISAALFALMHLNPWQVPTALFIGVLLGWVYWRTRSLALCVAGHAFHNSMNLLASGLPFTIDGFNRPHDSGTVLFQPWWLNLLGVVFVGGGIFWLKHLAPKVETGFWPAHSEPPPLPDQLSAEVVAGAVESESSGTAS